MGSPENVVSSGVLNGTNGHARLPNTAQRDGGDLTLHPSCLSSETSGGLAGLAVTAKQGR